MPPKLGILAGRGDLPGRLADACQASGRDYVILAFNGETDADVIAGHPQRWVDIAAVGRGIAALKDAQAEELVLIGPVGRPDFRSLRPDWRGARLLPRVIKAARSGDDAIMRVLVEELESEGFRVVGAENVLGSLSSRQGVLAGPEPDAGDLADIRRGADVLDVLGRLDIGQAVVVREGYVLAVEAAEGTDEMLRRCTAFVQPERGGVLVKLPKPGQERRADLPTIGLMTVKLCAEAGLKGIALEAGGALVVDADAVAEAAAAAGLFVYGLPEEPVG